VPLYILDTDIFSLWATNNVVVRARVAAHPRSDVAISILTVEEALVGWLTALRQVKTNDRRAVIYDRMTLTAAAMADLQSVSCSLAALDRYDQLLKLKLGVGGFDLRIAAIVLEHKATIVTRNLSDFRRVPGLTCEDWPV
jgi:tRNA(fMet)-specific endonuclease VapC